MTGKTRSFRLFYKPLGSNPENYAQINKLSILIFFTSISSHICALGLFMKPIVIATGVAFEFSNGRELFNNLNFSLDSRLTALVGPNGAGKTTLALLLSAELEPTHGAIRRHTPVTFFPQREAPRPISVDEYLTEDYQWAKLSEHLMEGIQRDTLCTNLSGGQWMRVRLARTLDDQFLILDEPTNDLDHEGREAVFQFLRERSGGVLLISHDRECLQLCENVLEISNQGLTKFGGGWSDYEASKTYERENLLSALELAKRHRNSANEERYKELNRQEKRNRRGATTAARGGMPKILIGARKRRAQATSGKIDATTLNRVNEAVREAYDAFSALKIDPIMYADLVGQVIPAQKLVAEANDFNVKFRNLVFKENLNFNWRGSIRIALKGANGSGKSTLLKAILGESFVTRGELRYGSLNVLYIDQRCAQLDDEKSVFENVRDVSNLTEGEIRNRLAQFLFTKEAVFQKVKTLSGGERLRAALACGLISTEKPELLILDEPTNNLDLANIEFLEQLTRAFRGALIVVSHDEIFLKNCEVNDQFKL